MAKHSGAQNPTRFSSHICTRIINHADSLSTSTDRATFLKNTFNKLSLLPTLLERKQLLQAINIPTLTPTLSLKYLHKLILHNMFELKDITKPNIIYLLTNEDFQNYYCTPIKGETTTLNYARLLLCEPSCQTNVSTCA